jgi:tetratricopeptide (TPR) repeat protein
LTLNRKPSTTSRLNSRSQFFRTTLGLKIIICVVLAGATLLPYIQVRNHAFITLDDDMYVTNNRMVLAGVTGPGLKWALTSQDASNWHPVTWLSHMVDSELYGSWAGGHHLTNLALHLANTVLLFLFLARVTQAIWPSALAAALFGLHPLDVESVAWVSERNDVLSALFWMLTMWAYVWYVAAPSVKRYLPVAVVFALGLMAKPMLVTLPLVLLLLDYWPLGRAEPALIPAPGASPESSRKPPPRRRVYGRLILEKIPLMVLAAGSCLITLAAQQGSGSVMPLAIRPLIPRFTNALVSYIKYIVKMFWPTPIAMFYPLGPIPWWQALGAGILLLALSALFLARPRRYPFLAVGWLWYPGTMVPVIGLVQVGGQALADRYTYIPFIGLFIMVAWGLFALTAPWRLRQAVRAGIAAVVLLACLGGTWVQAGYWRNSETLFRHAMEVTRGNYIAYNHLGMDLTNRGRLAQAKMAYRQALAVAPAYPPAYNNLGIVFAREGKFQEAVDNFKKAIALTPDNLSYYRNLAVVYARAGRKLEAAAVMEHVKWLRAGQGGQH